MSIYGMLIDRLAKSLYFRLRNFNDIKTSSTSKISKKAFIRGGILRGDINLEAGVRIIGGVYMKGKVSIDQHTTINGPNTDIYSLINEVSIGKFCSIARNVSIQEYNHDYNRLTSYYFKKNILGGIEQDDVVSKGAIQIGHDVWIGAHAVILSGSKIGNGAVVAANSVVSGEIPPYAIVGGMPARVIKYRFDEQTIKELETSAWWNFSQEKLTEYFNAFEKKRIQNS